MARAIGGNAAPVAWRTPAAASNGGYVFRRRKPLVRVLANRLEQSIARPPVEVIDLDQRRVYEVSEHREDVARGDAS